MRNHTLGEMVRAYQISIDRLKVSKIDPIIHIFGTMRARGGIMRPSSLMT